MQILLLFLPFLVSGNVASNSCKKIRRDDFDKTLRNSCIVHASSLKLGTPVSGETCESFTKNVSRTTWNSPSVDQNNDSFVPILSKTHITGANVTKLSRSENKKIDASKTVTQQSDEKLTYAFNIWRFIINFIFKPYYH